MDIIVSFDQFQIARNHGKSPSIKLGLAKIQVPDELMLDKSDNVKI